ncbi:ACP phosphodiesterase [Glaciecola sp. 2405UD65-10]|uniref:acyl carrier protein phosphodiesterase n=1 Tax=Glaciecola sp. 2405UD65-10 TaxID=3397244 RepID=UPI003B58FF4A
MNYLAHIHLAHLSGTSKLGNFLGDFVKGTNLQALPIHIQQGIFLHRKIDSFTDSHPDIKALKASMPNELRRMAGVIIDIYFDHLLSVQWHQYTKGSQQSILNGFYEELATQDITISPHFDGVKRGLLEYKWLGDYINQDAYLRAYKSIEQRLKYKIVFADHAFEYVGENRERIKTSFDAFYPSLVNFTLALSKQFDR